MPEQSSEVGENALHGGTASRALIWLGVSISVLVVGILLYYLLGADEEDEMLQQFCDKTLNGKGIENVAAKALKLGFDVRELQDTLLITVPGERLGQSCFIAIVEGEVSDVHSVVTH